MDIAGEDFEEVLLIDAGVWLPSAVIDGVLLLKGFESWLRIKNKVNKYISFDKFKYLTIIEFFI